MRTNIGLLTLAAGASAFEITKENPFFQYKKQFLTREHASTVEQVIEAVEASPHKLWQAGQNFLGLTNKTTDYQYLMGTFLGAHPLAEENPQEYTLPVKRLHHFDQSKALPKSFDPAKDGWPECTHSLTMVRDQGSCGSCWAFGAAEAMSDRVCIASGGAFHGDISSEDILACCGFWCGSGCNGGWPLQAWKYFKHHGVVTGGLYGDTKSGCLPYAIEPCEHHTTGPRKPCNGEEGHTPKCPKKCIPESGLNWKQDKHYSVSAYSVEQSEETIMRELMTNGPLEVAITVYEDFMTYKGGIYHHVQGKALGGHAIRLVGWGEETVEGSDEPVSYWVLANSWNTDWGENGFFRMRRGINECGVEGEAVGGIAEPNAFRRLFDDQGSNTL